MDLFTVTTPLQHQAAMDYGTYDGHIKDRKWGWECPSAFEIRESLTAPSEILQSAKDPDAYLYIRPVGRVGQTQWFTVSILQVGGSRVATGYNATSYTQKGNKVWPKP
jgi:hypothetical protein